MIKKYEEITKELDKKGHMIDLIIFYHLHWFEDFKKSKDNKKEFIIELLKNMYLESKTSYDLAILCDITSEFLKELLDDEIDYITLDWIKENIINRYYELI